MKILVRRVLNQTTPIKVEFSTKFGAAIGYWCTDTPCEGKVYFVELEVDGVLVWGEDLVEHDKDECLIGMTGDKPFIIGKLESVEVDGYTVIRLEESILILLTKGDAMPIGSYVKVVIDKLDIYDCNY